MKFVVFCIVLSTIVSLALTLEYPRNSTTDCHPCCPERNCDRRPAACRPSRICSEVENCKCRCKEGYLRDNISKRCVLPSDCAKI
uniref:Uncharacterized protein LOC114328752 isoform X2 n=1 Tax=Diabrotica virgifera virgifera TaxID=50390 RepID=A0A6P7FCV7_DIAVI